MRWLGLGLGLSLVVLLALAGAAYLWLRSSLPLIDGEIVVAGASAPIEIIRDRHGVPHIYARSENDAYFAMGFVHAQDRLWQMEVQRRTGAGRLSEIFGLRTLDLDRFLRTLGVYRVAEENWTRLDAEARFAYEAYAAGVNAYLDTRSGPLPPEFILFGVEPEPWRPADSLVWIKMMAWDLGNNWRDELLRAQLASRLPPERIAALWPPYPSDGPTVVADISGLYRDLPLGPLGQAGLEQASRAAGSNGWAVSGASSGSGQPLLANDPHLALEVPSQWYLAHLNAPGFEVIGATLPGLPAPVLGRTKRIAWAFTSTNPDVQDLYIERVHPTDPAIYETPEGWRPFTIRSETIRVRGTDPVELVVRESRHGPILSDALEGAAGIAGFGSVIALAWTALSEDDLTAQAGFKIIRARNWEEFKSALGDFHAPQQNVIYADVEGNIGFYAPGRVPIRGSGNGSLPSPGWTDAFDWTGFVPFEALPHGFNPASGAIVMANHKLVDESYPYFITNDWAPPYRARRIEDLLGARERHTVESFAAIQNDIFSEMAKALLPVMLDLAEARTPGGAKALERLGRWDFVMEEERAEPLIFSAWQRELVRRIFADELGEFFEAFWGPRPLLLLYTLGGAGTWCDDIETEAGETCADQTSEALEDALAYLEEAHGSDPTRWRWGDAHHALMVHKALSRIPLLGPLFGARPPTGGGPYTVNAAASDLGDAGAPFAQRDGPGYRAIYDLGAPERSLFIQNFGQSGHPLSPHFRDLVESWRDGSYLPMTTDRGEIERSAEGRLLLVPE